VVETAVLGPQRAVHLISVGARTLLIASTQSQITLLADVTGEEPQGQQAAPSFATVISQLLAPREEPAAGPAANLRVAAQRLREGAA
jgi:flagellar biogenesis protein FliO